VLEDIFAALRPAIEPAQVARFGATLVQNEASGIVLRRVLLPAKRSSPEAF